MRKYADTVQDASGNVISGATVTVLDYPAGTTSTVYSADSTSGANVNPLTTDSNGYFEFWAPTGHYSLTITKTGITTRTVTDVLLVDYESGTWTPTLTVASGAFTSAAATGTYTKNGDRLYFRVRITITTNNTAAGNIKFTLPTGYTPAETTSFSVIESAIVGYAGCGYVDTSAKGTVVKYDGTYLGGNGYVIEVAGQYRV